MPTFFTPQKKDRKQVFPQTEIKSAVDHFQLFDLSDEIKFGGGELED